MTSYNAEYFISKLAPIPEKLWNVGKLENSDNNSKCTAGWLGGYFSPETTALGKLFIKHLSLKIECPDILEGLRHFPSEIVFNVNDLSEFYGIQIKGTNPKERILTLLYQIRKKELQDGNLAAAKKIIANPKSVVHVKEFAVKRESGCYAGGD